MRKIVLALMFVSLTQLRADAAPYFRTILGKDASGHLAIARPQPIIGALIDPGSLGKSEAVSLLPLITHSPKDGCLLPGIVCEDWTPLAVGASMNAGKVTFDVAPLANILPWMQSAGRAVIPAGWTALRSVVEYSGEGDPITFSAGPAWQYRQLENKGYFKIVTALALHF